MVFEVESRRQVHPMSFVPFGKAPRRLPRVEEHMFGLSSTTVQMPKDGLGV